MRKDAIPVKQPCLQRGFTLVELVVAAAVSVLLFSMIVTSALYSWRIIRTRLLINEMRQNVRAGSDMLCRDLRAAGYGLDVPSTMLEDWVDWIPGFDANPLIIGGTSGAPDRVVIASAMDEPVAYLASAVTNGSTAITLSSSSHGLNTTERKVLFLGRGETVRVRSVNGSQLGISTHPNVTEGLRYGYASNTPVEMVRTVTYACHLNPTNYPWEPYLSREDSGRDTSYAYQDLAASHIEDLQVEETSDDIGVSIRGRTAMELPDYEDPDYGDGYRRFSLHTRIRPRHGD